MSAIDDEAPLDLLVEHGGRWAASRLSRRSFLGRVGQLAVVVASGPALATLLAEQAEARVCGQSGVSPLCPTFDCHEIWGWCWYASGCCADGLLKKICDCCAVNWPNVHGYCPAGTNVKCIVESCGTDPRVQTVAVHRLGSDDPRAVAAAVRELRFPGRSPELVLGDGESPLLGAVATPLATLVNGPVLLVPNADLDGAVLAEIERRGTVVVKVVGPALPPTIDAALAERGIAVERVGSSPDPASFSAEVAAWVRWVFGDRPYVCVEPGGLSAAAAPLAAAFAASKGWPLVVGAGTAGSGGAAYLVGPEAAARAGELLGPVPVAAPTLLGLSLDLASIARAEGGSPSTVALAPHSSPVTLALAGLGAPIVLHEPHSLDGARPWLHAHQRGAQRAVLAGSSGALPPEAYKELQSILNGFDAHKLIGVAGQGLPVIPQPGPEQPLGRARNGPAPPLPPAAPSRSSRLGRLLRVRRRVTTRGRRVATRARRR